MSRVHLPEYRKDPLSGRWVIIAEKRSQRPGSLVHEPDETEADISPIDSLPVDGCPFCPGAESETPREIEALRDGDSEADGPGWRVRVFGNKFPAVEEALELEVRPDPLHESVSGYGWHEVLVLSPDHHRHIDALEPAQVADVLCVLRQRVAKLMAQPGVAHVLPFKNKGRIAGASIDHPHFQIIGTPLLPPLVEDEIAAFEAHRTLHGSCLQCDLLQRELEIGTRVVAENEAFVGYTPWASRFPFEMQIAPRRHSHDLRDATDEEMRSLADLLVDLLQRLNIVAGTPPFNLAFHTAPADTAAESFHWHIEVMPKLTTPAGFEWGTGAHINPLSPERAAQMLIRAGLTASAAAGSVGQPSGAPSTNGHGNGHAAPSPVASPLAAQAGAEPGSGR